MPIFKMLVLVGLVRLLIATNKPMLCTGIYTALTVGTGLLLGGSVQAVAIAGLSSFASSGIYLWLLNRFDGSLLWWIILPLGVIVGFF